ncbi:UDP-glycosyltransferase 76C2 [Acorus calamus]|uniref:UDP-glycosyltransferase 76C2 n=1 Tax=Acorus calamus TaxID=4465 RepID=A0AAV9D786_ACOCL|nr:UDP-glycosyltransferase 76C2 [Acorus calamus]
MNWLDAQPPKSVVYVSFGSIATMTRDQLLEFWHGLVNSEMRFLWVLRDNLVVNADGEHDQQINSRYVSDVWKVGLDMKDTCDRVIVEKMVREMMEEGERSVGMRRSASEFAEKI